MGRHPRNPVSARPEFAKTSVLRKKGKWRRRESKKHERMRKTLCDTELAWNDTRPASPDRRLRKTKQQE